MLTRRRRSEGQALVLVSLAFVFLVACAGLSLDGANAFGQSRRVSNAADAASLAATRVLLSIQRSGQPGLAISNTIREFLVNDNSIDANRSTWQASYVSRDAPDTIIAPVSNGTVPPANASGIRVDLRFTFDTLFMRVLGQDTLTVGAMSTSVYGPLGSTTGADIIPLGLSVSASNTLQGNGSIRVDLKGTIVRALNVNDPIPPDVITDANFAHVALGALPSGHGNANGCYNPNVDGNLTYWWCNGTQSPVQIGQDLPRIAPNWGQGDLNSAIIHHIQHQATAIVPVYSQVPDGLGGVTLQLAYFMGADLSYTNGRGVLTMTLRNDYIASGAMIGQGSAVTGVWAVNLKR